MAKANEINLMVSIDGKYHSMKGKVNQNRKEIRDEAFQALKEICKLTTIDKAKYCEAKKLMKKAAYVNGDIIRVAIDVFLSNGFKVFGAPFESDFQLVFWEMSGLTDGTITTDSDIFVMGSRLVVDLLDLESSDGKCKILERDNIMSKDSFMKGSRNWGKKELIMYSALCGCDFIKRLYNLKQTEIEKFMAAYTEDNERLEQLLNEFSTSKKWPAGNRKAGSPATDFGTQFKKCVGLMMHAPVISVTNNQYTIVPLTPLDEDANWKQVIGFDPIEEFGQISVQDTYTMKIWARFECPIPPIELPIDETTRRKVPHGGVIHFNDIPPDILPSTVLLRWLYLHGVPMPKTSKHEQIVAEVRRAIKIKQPLDYDIIEAEDIATTKSWISWEKIVVLSEVIWTGDKEMLLSSLRNESFPTINHKLIEELFGEGKNGVRERAMLRFQSGHLNIETFRMATIFVKGVEGAVNIFEMKVTPSMKSVVYSVYILVTHKGEYLSKLSRCDCPNGWLFCSHTLASFLLVYLIQTKFDWSFEDIVRFMPVPIKSLTNEPFAASYVFGQLNVSKKGWKKGKNRSTQDEMNEAASVERDYASAIGRDIARQIPGYSGRYSINEDDAIEEAKTIDKDIELSFYGQSHSIDLCSKVDELINGSAIAKEIDTEKENEGGILPARTGNDNKVTLDKLRNYNRNLVNKEDSTERQLEKLVRHERLYQTMRDKKISQNNSLWYYLEHFASDRKTKIEELTSQIESSAENTKNLPLQYEKDYLAKYFGEEADLSHR